MATELDELVAFLSSPSPQVRKTALGIVQGYTGTDEGIRLLGCTITSLIPPLRVALGDEDMDVAREAAGSLVNLSQDARFTEVMVADGVVQRVMELLFQPQRAPVTRLYVMLLLNLSQSEKGASIMLEDGDQKLAGLFVSRLVRIFSRYSEDEDAEDRYEHVPAVLLNLTTTPSGRQLFLDRKRGLLKMLLRQMDAKSLIRKKGVTGLVRNCCFEADNHLSSLLEVSQFLWPALLLPLAGSHIYPEEDTRNMPAELAVPLSMEREVEKDPRIRLEAAESIYLIVQQEEGKQAFQSVNGPRIVKRGYEDETDPEVCSALERLGSLVLDLLHEKHGICLQFDNEAGENETTHRTTGQISM